MDIEGRNLGQKTQSMLESSDADRIDYINEDRFINYTAAKNLLEEFDEILHKPRVNRPPCMLLLGRSDNGKTELLKEFQRRHDIQIKKEDECIDAPVIYIQTPPSPSKDLLLSFILQKLGETVRSSDSSDQKLFRVKTLLPRIGTKLLLIDELNHILSGSDSKQQEFLNTIKFLSNDLQLNVIVSSVPDTSTVFTQDNQYKSRFPRSVLPKWENDADLRRFLDSLERTLPLREESGLKKSELATLIYSLSYEGTLGEICKTVRSAAEYAIKKKIEKITVDAINNCNHIKRRENVDFSKL